MYLDVCRHDDADDPRALSAALLRTLPSPASKEAELTQLYETHP